jgi:hypothetical protein
MEITKQQIAAGYIDEGEPRDHQILVKINDTVSVSIINMREIAIKWYGKPIDDEYTKEGVEYEIGLVVANPIIMKILIDYLTFAPWFIGKRITTYYYLTIEEVNEFVKQVREFKTE